MPPDRLRDDEAVQRELPELEREGRDGTLTLILAADRLLDLM